MMHERKLQLIQESKDSKMHAVPHIEETKIISKSLKKRKEELKRAHDFITSEQNIQINRNNQLLLSKLVEISNGKWASVPTTKDLPPIKHKSLDGSKGHNKSRYQSQSSVSMVRSLNLAVRKRETDRIERENHAIARRLFDR